MGIHTYATLICDKGGAQRISYIVQLRTYPGYQLKIYKEIITKNNMHKISHMNDTENFLKNNIMMFKSLSNGILRKVILLIAYLFIYI